jgi:hypothetical protein
VDRHSIACALASMYDAANEERHIV